MKYDIYQLPTATPGPGKSVFLLGQSEDGPVNTPVPVRSLAEAVNLFRNGNLIDAYTQVENVSGITVYLMRITGEYARVALLGEIEAEEVPVLKFRSIFGGERYNGIHIYTRDVERDGVEVKALIIESPDVDTPGVSYVLSDYSSIHELIYSINTDTRMKRSWVYASSSFIHESPDILGELNTVPMGMSGGNDGMNLSKDEIYIALDTSYSVLEGREVDVICPYPARFDDAHPSFYYGDSSYGNMTYGKGDFLGLVDTEHSTRNVTFHEQLIDFCRMQERFGITTHGVIGLREVENPGERNSYYLSRLIQASAFIDRHGLVEYQNGSWVDKGHYISVLAQDFTFEGGLEANGCALYAGLVASLDPNETTTNLAIPDGIELRFELELGELRDLASIGAVAARRSVKSGIVITNGVTAGLEGSPLQLIQNIRMVQFTLYVINKVLEGMVGETFTPVMTLKEIDRKVQEGLLHCVSTQILKTFEYSVRFNGYTQGVQIDLQLMPRNSIEFTDARAGLKFNSGGDA